jgi:hypothetical protein
VLDILSTGFSWAIAGAVPLISGDCGDQAVVARLIREIGIEVIIHFAASVGSLLTSILGWIPRQPTSWNCVGGKRRTAKK